MEITKNKKIKKIFSIGYVDLTFQIELTDKEMKKPYVDNLNNLSKEEQKQNYYYKLEDLKSISDLAFLSQKKTAWNFIKLKTGNDTLNQLLLANEILNEKNIIDYIGYGIPKFEKDESFFNEIFQFVTLKNYLFINETPLDENGPYNFLIELKYKGETKKINHPNKKEEDNENNENVEDIDNNNENNNKKKEKKKKESNNKDNSKKNIKINFNRQESVLNNISPTFDRYEFLYINYIDIKQIPGDYEMIDLLDLLKYFKTKGTTIFINFWESDTSEKPKEEEENNENDEEEEKYNDFEENIVDEEENKGNYKKYGELKELYDLTHIFFFNTKQAQKEFKNLSKYILKEKFEDTEKIADKGIFNFFIKIISQSNPNDTKKGKTGFFMENFEKLTIAISSKEPKIEEYDCSLKSEKKNNKDKKEKIKEEDKYNILFSFLIHQCALLSPKCHKMDDLYKCILLALKTIKNK